MTDQKKYIRFERSLPHQVRDVISDCPIAYVPLGALEWHGEHSALGLDGIKAEWICRRAAERTGGVLFPTVYWGAFNTMPFPFTFAFSKRAFRKQLRKTLTSLAGWGFTSIVLLSGHYPTALITMLRRECRKISRRKKIGALGIPEQALTLDRGYLGDHAALWETSILMAIDESLVDLDRLPEDGGDLWQRSLRHGIEGIYPRGAAAAEKGREILDLIVERLAEAATAMVETGGPAPAEDIYRRHRDAFRKPFRAARIAYGVESRWEIIRFTIKSILHSGHF